jgi:hypothetical protein
MLKPLRVISAIGIFLLTRGLILLTHSLSFEDSRVLNKATQIKRQTYRATARTDCGSPAILIIRMNAARHFGVSIWPETVV